MNDNLSIVITIIVMVILLVIFPLYNFFERQDDMSYNYALSVTTSFVDDVLNKGYITQDMYSDYMTRLGNTGNIYDVKLEGQKRILTNNPNNIKDKTYNEQYKIDYNDDILEKADKENVTSIESDSVLKNNAYYLNIGDQFYVKLKNTNTTMAGAIFNSIIPTSKKEKIAINYGGVVKNNTWTRIESTNMYTNPNKLNESRIEGPFDQNGNTLTSIIQGSTVYFKAYLFNSIMSPQTHNCTGDITVTRQDKYFSIKVTNIRGIDGKTTSNAYISSLDAQTTRNEVDSASFTIFDISTIKPQLTANPNIISGADKIVIINNNIRFTAKIAESWVNIDHFVWKFTSQAGDNNTYETAASNNYALRDYTPTNTGAYTYEVYGVDRYGNHTGTAGGFFMSLPSRNSNGSFPMNSSMAGEFVSIDSMKIDGARVSSFVFDVNVSPGHYSGNEDYWRIEGFNTYTNSWEYIYTQSYTWYDKYTPNSVRTGYGQTSGTNTVSKGVNVKGTIDINKSYSYLKFSYKVASGHASCINSNSKITYDVTYDFNGL